MPAPLPDETRDHIRDLHAQGLSANAIAKTAGCAVSSVTRICKQLGLSFERAQTKAATEAVHLDLAARRALLQERLVAQGERLMNRIDAGDAGEWHTLVKAQGGAERPEVLPFIPVRDLRDAVWTVGTYLANEERIRKGTGDGSVDVARTVIGDVMAGLRVIASETPDVEVPEQRAGE